MLKPWQSFRAVKGQECQDRTSGQLTTNYSLPELQCTQASPKPTHGGCKVTIWIPGVAELPCPSCHMLGGILIRRLTELASLNPQRCAFFWRVKGDQRGGQGMTFCQAEGAGCEFRCVYSRSMAGNMQQAGVRSGCERKEICCSGLAAVFQSVQFWLREEYCVQVSRRFRSRVCVAKVLKCLLTLAFGLSLTRINAHPVSRNWMARVVSGTRVPGIAQTLAELSRC